MRSNPFTPELLQNDASPLSIEIYRSEPTRRRECLYYLALGYYKMGNHEEARRFNCA